MAMDDATTTALVASLMPWMQALGASLTYKLKNPARTELGVVCTLSVVFHPLEAARDDAIIKLREAIDLVYRVLALHTALALQFEDDTSEIAYMIRGHDDPSFLHVLRVLRRDAPFAMTVDIAVQQLQDAAVLKCKLGDEFLVELAQTPSADTAYLAVKEELDKMLEKKNARWADALKDQPIQVKGDVEMMRQFGMDISTAERVLAGLLEFAHVVDTYEVPSSAGQGHLPVQFDIGTVQLSPMPITPRVARTVTAMINMQRARLNCGCVTIDACLVACSRHELAVFLQAITKGVTNGVEVKVHPSGFGLRGFNPMENQVDDTNDFIQDLLEPIARCENVACIHLGGLLDLFRAPEYRQTIYHVLIDSIFDREKPMDVVLSLAAVDTIDAHIFSTALQLWRRENPGVPLRVKALSIGLFDVDFAFTNVLLGALDGIEELSIKNCDSRSSIISSAHIRKILEKFRTLRMLSLGHVQLESMHIFSDLAPPTLQSISLCGLRLIDRHSFTEFIEDLGYPERPLTKQLREFKMSKPGFMEDPATLRVSAQEVNCLVQVLQSNRVLETIKVILKEDNIKESVSQDILLKRAAGFVIPAPRSVRQSMEEKSRRVAFLSVLYKTQRDPCRPVFDTFVVRQVFAFSDPWVTRSIHTY